MTWEEKFAAICALAPFTTSLKMRMPGNWYVSWPVETVEHEDSTMLHGRYGNGTTPQLAIEDHWTAITEREPLAYLVLNADSADRRHVRWNGYMWADIPIPRKVTT